MSLPFLLFLAVVQGVTEFLPVSSSGHLALLPQLADKIDQGLVMDVSLHAGTLLAALLYYRQDFARMISACVAWRDPSRAADRLLLVLLAVATVPTAVAGYVLFTFLPEGIRVLWVIAVTTLVFGVVMGVADRFCRRDRVLAQMGLRDAVLIGLAQVLALIPGTSRSGITLTAARALGYERVEAARFSFWLSVPAIFGAGFLAVRTLVEMGSAVMWRDALIGFSVSFVAGLLSIHFMIRWLGRFGLVPFAVYRVLVGAGLVAYIVFWG